MRRGLKEMVYMMSDKLKLYKAERKRYIFILCKITYLEECHKKKEDMSSNVKKRDSQKNEE